MTSEHFWLIFAIIFGIGVVTSLARFPLLMTTLGTIPNIHNEWEEEFDEFTSKYTAMATLDLLPSLLVEGILLAIATILGLLLAHSIHLGAPLLEALLVGKNVETQFQDIIMPGLWFGIGIGLALLLIERLLFRNRLRKIVHYAPTRWNRWKFILASFHQGIALEVFLRLFCLSLVAWMLSRIWHTPTGAATPAVLWSSNILISIFAAFIYRQGVLLTSALAGMYSPLIVTRTVLLDGLLGIVFGYLFWHYGLEASITADLVAGVFLQLFGGRPPLPLPMPEELAKPLLDQHRKRFGVQIGRLGGAPRFEFSNSLYQRTKDR